MLRGLVFLVLIGVLAATAVFALQNQEQTTSHFLTMSWEGTPVGLPVLASALAVLVTCLVYGFLSGVRWRIRHGRLSREFDDYLTATDRLEQENLELREKLARLRAGGDRMPADR